uniref:Transposase and inactivated derivatives n=1 Tax=Rheinheimera sp. BAL341 TaxID=1708203 RepID=A0A486XIV5_9GAMM
MPYGQICEGAFSRCAGTHQRGNNRQLCFACEGDIAAYAYCLKEYADKFQVQIHAWVFMTNHVHLLCSAADSSGISLMMQSMGRQYVRYFNRLYQRSGSIPKGVYLIRWMKHCLRIYP